jgi:hypothetical protein
MSIAAKVLIGLACLAFLGGLFTAFVWPILPSVPPESFSRGTNNLALIAIALLLLCKGNPSTP